MILHRCVQGVSAYEETLRLLRDFEHGDLRNNLQRLKENIMETLSSDYIDHKEIVDQDEDTDKESVTEFNDDHRPLVFFAPPAPPLPSTHCA